MFPEITATWLGAGSDSQVAAGYTSSSGPQFHFRQGVGANCTRSSHCSRAQLSPETTVCG